MFWLAEGFVVLVWLLALSADRWIARIEKRRKK
jgi:type IV secretory pathway TrbD component